MDSKTFATLAFLAAFGAKQSLLTYFADLSGPALRYSKSATLCEDVMELMSEDQQQTSDGSPRRSVLRSVLNVKTQGNSVENHSQMVSFCHKAARPSRKR